MMPSSRARGIRKYFELKSPTVRSATSLPSRMRARTSPATRRMAEPLRCPARAETRLGITQTDPVAPIGEDALPCRGVPLAARSPRGGETGDDQRVLLEL